MRYLFCCLQEKFKQLRLKFEQRRSMRSQAAKNEAQSDTNDANDASATAAPGNKPEKSEDVLVKCVAMPVKSTPSVETNKMQADMNMAADSDKGDFENKKDTTKEKRQKRCQCRSSVNQPKRNPSL